MFLSNGCSRPALFALLAVACALDAVRMAQADKPERDRAVAEAAVKELFRIEVSPGKDSISRFITFYVISPDNKTLAYCDVNRIEAGKPDRSELVLLDLTTGKELQRLRVEPAWTGIYSPDGKFLALGTPRSKTAITVWDVAAWKPKVQLKRPDDHLFGTPLVISPDGKLVAGRAQRGKGKYHPDFSEDLVLWEVATGDCRVLEDRRAKRFSRQLNMDGSSYTVFLEGKDGSVKWPPPGPTPSGIIVIGAAPRYASFPDTPGSDRLFVEYNMEFGSFVTVWDTARGKALSTEFPLGARHWTGLVGFGLLVPDRRADYFRFRTAPSGRVLELPRYGPPPVTAYAEDDGTIMLAITPIEKQWGYRKPYNPGFPYAKELCRLADYKGATGAPRIALSPDGRRLVALGLKPGTEKTKTPTYVLRVWDISALHPIASKKMEKLAGADRERLWDHLFEDLVDSDKTQEYQFSQQFQAMVSLVLHGDDAVAWLRKKMGPPSDPPKKVSQLILDLDSDDFDTRERASRDLERLGRLARPFLERALKKGPSAEMKRRVEELLDRLKKETADASELRQMRIIDVLEHINTAAARKLLQLIADGKYDPSFADEAKQALRRAAAKR
jgi:hypothetical protein